MGQAGAIWAGAWRKRSTCPRGPRRTGCRYAVDRGLRDDLAFTVVESLTEHEIRAAFVNCSKGEAKRLHVPRTGKAGQQGNSVGAYICGDLACPLYTRGKKFTSSSTPAPGAADPGGEGGAEQRQPRRVPHQGHCVAE